LGWAYLQEGDNNEAVVKFQRGLELDARNGDALIGLGSAERQRGNLEAAMRAYDLYLGRHPRGDKVSIAQYQLDALKRQLGL
jgi:Flp pilus assembly protein TadD